MWQSKPPLLERPIMLRMAAFNGKSKTRETDGGGFAMCKIKTLVKSNQG